MTHGAGLGLAIARQLARRMGGDIRRAQRGPGHGRGVHRDARARAAGGRRPIAGTACMAERIAIVEDERLVRELVAVNLRHAGYEIVAAENFEQGTRVARAARISSSRSST